MALWASRYTVTIGPRGEHGHTYKKALGPRYVRPRDNELVDIARELVPGLAIRAQGDEQEFSIRLFRRKHRRSKPVRLKSLHFRLTPQRDGIVLQQA